MSVEQHHHGALRVARCAVLTVSDTRTVETDTSGQLMRALLEEAGHQVASHRIVPDEAAVISTEVAAGIADAEVDAVLITGGTGISPRDVTIEAVTPLLEKILPGFGELFRMLSFEEIGPAALLSRAVAGVAGGTAVFASPGSRGAVRLAMSRLILPELGHIIKEARKAHR